MELNSLKLLKPVIFFIILAIVGLLASCILITTWCIFVKNIEHNVDSSSEVLHSQILSQVKNASTILHSLGSSAKKVARILNSSMVTNTLRLPQIKINVAPLLFEALSIVPYVSQISYTDKDGLSFVYFTEDNNIFAAYSNSNSSSDNKDQSWYMQQACKDNGELFGKVIEISPLISSNSSWLRTALNDSHGYATIENGWNSAQELNFFTAASVGEKWVISMGFPVKHLTKFLIDIKLYNGILYMSTKDGKMLLQGLSNILMTVNDNFISLQMVKYNNVTIHIGDVQCDGDKLNPTSIKIQQTKYTFYCSSSDIVGVPTVYALAFENNKLASLISRKFKVILGLLILMVSILLINVLAFIPITIKGSKREIELGSLLIKHMEATQQAERKSMNKSHAIASASHDIRANLAGITGLIDICYSQVTNTEELKSNLKKMACDIDDLLQLLNSILDTSKIEAGKIQLEDGEFSLIQLIEDVVDLFHPVGMKKGLDVVLDTCDNSVIKFSKVRGDKGRLKQVLCNLLSNAVKFTSEGHVSIRAWVRKRSIEKSIMVSNEDATLNCLSWPFHKNKDSNINLNNANTHKQNSLEFVFEVDDTGQGIPMEQQQSVFENYVQVKETVVEGGTGLGLGIVQSIVRLMGGEIGIMDKEIGERGTCFKFNVFLTVCESGLPDCAREDDIKLEGSDDMHLNNNQLLRHITITSNRGLSTSFSTTPKFSPRHEKSKVILLIQNDERRRVIQKFMEKLGLRVISASKWDDFLVNFKKVKHKLSGSSSGRFAISSRSDLACGSASREITSTTKDILLGSKSSTDFVLPLSYRKTNVRSPLDFALIVIDSSVVPLPFSGVHSTLADIKSGLGGNGSCQVVWLHNPITSNTSSTTLEAHQDDIIMTKPLHGTRLFDLVRILPEFGGAFQGRCLADYSGLPFTPFHVRKTSESFSYASQSQAQTLKEPDTAQVLSSNDSDKALNGKNILIVEDSPTLQLVTSGKLKKLGATVEICNNGKEAICRFNERMTKLKEIDDTSLLPYHYIFMDCEMPVMNGYEATKKIREIEKDFGVHIPIIALTAHSSLDEINKTKAAGMDAHLVKPFDDQIMLDTILNLKVRTY